MYNEMKKYIFYFLATLCLTACTLSKQEAEKLGKAAKIFPDYAGTLLPVNLSPPTFALTDSTESLDNLQAVFSSGEKTVVVANDGEEGFCLSESDWKKLKEFSQTISVTIQGKKNDEWVEYEPFEMFISPDSIDNTIVYRLIEPGYEVWNEMGIYQRNIENYEEEAIITNRQTDGGCMNCHSFCNYDPEALMFHLRLNYAGTYVKKASPKLRKLVSPKSLVYPSWHQSGRFIAFSQNKTKQMFHTTDRNRIEVFDISSDVVVYDLETDTLLCTPLLMSKEKFETFPSWSADGKTLFFCCADSVEIPADYDKVHYSLCSISFDPEKKAFGDSVTVLFDGAKAAKSVSFPRCSPDGKYIVYTLSNYGNFSIWHRESRLMMLPLEDIHTSEPISLLTDFRASYHSWSSSSRWMVMASRQDDGLYTRPYIVHISPDGKVSKPFALPQPDAGYYLRKMKSYNLPEFVKGKVNVDFQSENHKE